MSTVEQRGSSSRRQSRFGSLFSLPNDSAPKIDPVTGERTFHGQQQTSFLGRKMSVSVVPAFARKKSEAIAKRTRDNGNLLMGESDAQAEANLNEAFYKTKLTIDEVSDDEMKEKLVIQRKMTIDKGKAKADWQTKLGWDKAPPKGGKRGRQVDRESLKRKHRTKRAQRELDNDLDRFNSYAQNGLTPITRSTSNSRNGSQVSLPSMLLTKALALEGGVLDSDNAYLPNEERARAVPVGDGFDALDVMADHIFRLGVQRKKWFKAPKMGAKRDEIATGVTIRAKTGLYRTFPVDYEALQPFEEAISRLNPEVSSTSSKLFCTHLQVAIKIRSQIISSIMDTYM